MKIENTSKLNPRSRLFNKTMITRVHYLKDRVDVYIDDKYCRSIKPDIWQEMGLHEGSITTCHELKKHEFLCRNKDNTNSPTNKRKRWLPVDSWILKKLPEVKLISVPQSVNGKSPRSDFTPNLILLSKDTEKELAVIKVIGIFAKTNLRNWIQLDTLNYAKKNPERDVFIASCTNSPSFSISWIKPDTNICYTEEEFVKYIKDKIAYA